jgi:putative ABC transport system ATP-binding protein
MIRVRDLVMRLPSGSRLLTVLDSVSIDVAPGEFVAITGPSGSGKSTLLGLVAGLDQPTAGTITVAGVEITGLAEDALTRFRRETIGYVFQSYHLIPTLTAAENVAVPLELDGIADARPRALALLGEVTLADRAGHYPVQLSGGEQQRVALARAVALGPRVLLADEPTGNLDSTTGAQIIDLLLKFRQERDSTLVLVTHDPALSHHADRVIMLRDGRVVSSGGPEMAPTPPRSQRPGEAVTLLDHRSPPHPPPPPGLGASRGTRDAPR